MSRNSIALASIIAAGCGQPDESPNKRPLDTSTPSTTETTIEDSQLAIDKARALAVLDAILPVIDSTDCPHLINPEAATHVTVDTFGNGTVNPYQHCVRFSDEIADGILDEMSSWGSTAEQLRDLSAPFSVVYEKTGQDPVGFLHFNLIPLDENLEALDPSKALGATLRLNAEVPDYLENGIKHFSELRTDGIPDFVWSGPYQDLENHLSLGLPAPREGGIDYSAAFKGFRSNGDYNAVMAPYEPDERFEPMEAQLDASTEALLPLMEELIEEGQVGTEAVAPGTVYGVWTFDPNQSQ